MFHPNPPRLSYHHIVAMIAPTPVRRSKVNPPTQPFDVIISAWFLVTADSREKFSCPCIDGT
ncbi:hypothetical protein K443DRAFT_674710 [Laccaria amethystina LaAM-08-1]|uniref:Uncharacterized protein n=1 Tax=Laccaria amethystina LaAM-08-1 TaxID=1095629 RepID=A0A0C9Y7F9_9AGAR|nr:hypothetical protein K443DRAFT_674710 [Laccaria amethystina LaAM-08-1]